MKIKAILYPQSASRLVLRDLPDVHEVSAVDAEGRLTTLLDGPSSQLVLVEDGALGDSTLQQVEEAVRRHPTTTFVLLAQHHTPEFLLRAMRVGIREVLRVPLAERQLLEVIERVEAKQSGAQPPHACQVLAFLPCKGGNGATFLGANLGWILAERSRVLLIDLNLRFGDALSFVHDAEAPSTLADVTRHIARLDAALLASSCVRASPNYAVLAAPHDPSEAMDVTPADIDALITVAVANYDFVILDLDRSLDPVAIRALDRCDRIYPVMQASVTDLRNAQKIKELLRGLGYPPDRVEVILNRHDKGSEITLEQVRRALGSTPVTTVPNAWVDASTSANRGDPIAKRAASSSLTRALALLARALQPAELPRGWVARFFGRGA